MVMKEWDESCNKKKKLTFLQQVEKESEEKREKGTCNDCFVSIKKQKFTIKVADSKTSMAESMFLPLIIWRTKVPYHLTHIYTFLICLFYSWLCCACAKHNGYWYKKWNQEREFKILVNPFGKGINPSSPIYRLNKRVKWASCIEWEQV